MAFFDWKDEYSVGIEKLDEQHKQLVSYLNDLYGAMKAGRGTEVLDEVLTGMVAYTKTHFSTEESLMKLYKFPGYDLHKEKHESMTRAVLKLYDKFKTENTSNILEIANYLKAWLANHIMGTDKLYRAYLREKGVR